MVVIAGIVSIAIADSFSDVLGHHVAKEFSRKHSQSYIWAVTYSTFFSKLLFAIIFLVPILLFQLKTAIILSVIFGLFAIVFFSYKIAILNKEKPFDVIVEHVLIAIVVIVVTFYTGKLVDFYIT